MIGRYVGQTIAPRQRHKIGEYIMKTSELTGPALDWAVAKCEFPDPDYYDDDRLVYVTCELGYDMGLYSPSTDWAQGGPIIERECIDTVRVGNFNWKAETWCERGKKHQGHGPTPLIAAMRCYVASKLGDEVDVPEELTK